MDQTQLYYYQGFTLIDITPTGCVSYSVKNELKRNQQRNWETVQQVLSLRTQPNIIKTKSLTAEINDYSFGINYTGKHKIWTFTFSVEYENIYREGSDMYGLLRHDFKVTPIILGLTETARPEHAIFYTSGPWNNIYFKSITI